MNQRISKRNIKSYIEFLKKELQKKSKKIEKMQKENDESKQQLYDLTEEYLTEERIKGQIESAYYILNNC